MMRMLMMIMLVACHLSFSPIGLLICSSPHHDIPDINSIVPAVSQLVVLNAARGGLLIAVVIRWSAVKTLESVMDRLTVSGQWTVGSFSVWRLNSRPAGGLASWWVVSASWTHYLPIFLLSIIGHRSNHCHNTGCICDAHRRYIVIQYNNKTSAPPPTHTSLTFVQIHGRTKART